MTDSRPRCGLPYTPFAVAARPLRGDREFHLPEQPPVIPAQAGIQSI
ncbi:MAG: hypothetical protein PF630_04550 [Gammaproteobacteria bacterium]|nr:hypothetical protein [Gammaproteobacteria bacterium]